MNTYTVGENRYTQKQAVMLCALLKAPLPLIDCNGFDRNALTALADLDLIEMDDTHAKITAAGRAVVIELSAKVNGETKPPKAETKPRGKKTTKPKRGTARGKRRSNQPKRESPPPTGVVDFGFLRRALLMQYESDLASIDRTEAIHRVISPDGE